ncbi:glycosyltransferase family 4 protein [Thermovibrio sp.]
MRILQATTARGWSGGTEQCLLLAKYMNQMGVEAHVLTIKGTELEKRVSELGIKVVNFPNRKRFSLREARKLGEILSNYDVVNTHISKAHWWVWSASFFSRKRPKVVYTRRVPFKISLISRLTKYNFGTDGLIAVSPQIYSYLKETPLLGKKVRYIPSGVELERFNPKKVSSEIRKELKIEEGALILLNVANYSEVKGHHILLPAFKELLRRNPGLNAYLLLVGRDTTSSKAQKEIERLALRGRVIPLGFRKDVPQLLKGADLFVFPSLNEGIAGSLLQAMAMEKIVVASLVGGIRSYLKDGVNGIGIEPANVESLVEGIERGIKELKNEKMKREARKTAQEFDIKRVAEKTLQFYEELLNGGKVSRI